MDAERKGNPALVVVLSILGILAITLTAGLLLFQKQEASGSSPGNVLFSRQETRGSDEFDPISWAREGAEYPPLQIEEETKGDFVADYTGTGNLPEAEPAKPVVTTQPAAVKTTPAPAVEKPAPKPAFKEVKENAYWVQVIATSNMSKAETIRDDLSNRGLPAHVLTQETGSETVYRVRLGAFDGKEEAESYAAKVRKIAGFGDSYVTQAPVTRQIPVSN
jgi:hypothetical protein